jgi:hypothetical protein
MQRKRFAYERCALATPLPVAGRQVPKSWTPRSSPPHAWLDAKTAIAIEKLAARFRQCRERGWDRKNSSRSLEKQK